MSAQCSVLVARDLGPRRAFPEPNADGGGDVLQPRAKYATLVTDQEESAFFVELDLRTLVIGTPDGSFGFILNRGGPLPSDRLAAAREILDWNGYDTRNLALFR